ncbi:MAG TPA: hypothetical protein PLO65_05470 [Caulobacter sp.]|nr:hypothetical protein [Caulobacter sp.]
MRSLRLMADYQCFPLWEASPGLVGNVDPATLPLSADLRADLLAWAAAFDATLDLDDPARSGFTEAASRARFRLEGESLGQRLREELGPGWPVILDLD